MSKPTQMHVIFALALGTEVFLRANPEIRGRVIGLEVSGDSASRHIVSVLVRRNDTGECFAGSEAEFDSDDIPIDSRTPDDAGET